MDDGLQTTIRTTRAGRPGEESALIRKDALGLNDDRFEQAECELANLHSLLTELDAMTAEKTWKIIGGQTEFPRTQPDEPISGSFVDRVIEYARRCQTRTRGVLEELARL